MSYSVATLLPRNLDGVFGGSDDTHRRAVINATF
jgi:hypothetical protein